MTPASDTPAYTLGTFAKAGGPTFAGLVWPRERVIDHHALAPWMRARGLPCLRGNTVLELLAPWAPSHTVLNEVAQANIAPFMMDAARWEWEYAPGYTPEANVKPNGPTGAAAAAAAHNQPI